MASNLFDNAGENALTDGENIVLAKGTTVPTDATSGYQVGCIFMKTDGGQQTSLYVNEGSTTSCDFNAVNGYGGTEAVVATATGVSVTNGSKFVTVTVTTDLNDIVKLPNSSIGSVIYLQNGATGYELRSSAPATIAINGGTGASVESAIPASTLVRMVRNTATTWIGNQFAVDGTESAVEAAA